MANSLMSVVTTNTVMPEKKFSATGEPILTTPSGKEIPLFDTPFECRMIQPGSIGKNPELAPHMNKFYFPEIEQSVEELKIIPIKFVNYTRAMFPTFDNKQGSNDPICRSSDGLMPDPRIDMPQNLKCAEYDEQGKLVAVCPMAIWDNSSTVATPPKCTMTEVWMFYDVNLNIPFYWQLKGTSLSAFNKLKRDYKKYQNANRFKGISTANTVVIGKIKNEGTYVKPEFSFANESTVEDIAGIIAFYEKMFSHDTYQEETPVLEESATPAIETSEATPEQPEEVKQAQVVQPVTTAKTTKETAEAAKTIDAGFTNGDAPF